MEVGKRSRGNTKTWRIRLLKRVRDFCYRLRYDGMITL
ncbi:MAG: hypothetical protein ACLTS6_14835 [Anaerobutyricum sp.]